MWSSNVLPINMFVYLPNATMMKNLKYESYCKKKKDLLGL